MINLIHRSSIKDVLFSEQEKYGIFKSTTKKECLDTGNVYGYLPYNSAQCKKRSMVMSRGI